MRKGLYGNKNNLVILIYMLMVKNSTSVYSTTLHEDDCDPLYDLSITTKSGPRNSGSFL